MSQQEVVFGPNLSKYNCVCISFLLFRYGPLTIRNIRFFQVNFLCHKLIFLKYWTRVLLNYFHFCNTLLSKHEPSFFRLQLKINRNLIKTAVGELDQFVFQKQKYIFLKILTIVGILNDHCIKIKWCKNGYMLIMTSSIKFNLGISIKFDGDRSIEPLHTGWVGFVCEIQVAIFRKNIMLHIYSKIVQIKPKSTKVCSY